MEWRIIKDDADNMVSPVASWSRHRTDRSGGETTISGFRFFARKLTMIKHCSLDACDQSLRLRAGKIVFGDAKRLLQHYLLRTD
jgi:hypothetical protein